MTRSRRRRPTTNRATRSGRITQILRAYLHTSGGICHWSVVCSVAPPALFFVLGVTRASQEQGTRPRTRQITIDYVASSNPAPSQRAPNAHQTPCYRLIKFVIRGTFTPGGTRERFSH